MKWPLCFARTLEAERHRCANAINSALYWQRQYDDSTCVGYARGVALEAVIRAWPIETEHLIVLAHKIESGGQAPQEVREIAASEIRRMAGIAPAERAST